MTLGEKEFTGCNVKGHALCVEKRRRRRRTESTLWRRVNEYK